MALTEAEVEKWLTGLSAFDNDNRTILFCIFAAFGMPVSFLDVGSGTGAMVNTAEKLGIDVNGLDQLPRPAHPKLIQHDLRKPIDLGRRYELVTSIETAEHLEPEYADTFVDTIVKHANKRIVFTAAMPGQIGDGHLNCVVGETLLRASGIRAATRRFYDGQIVTIITRGGNELTVTPNHPVLTQGGWVAAHRLQEGDNVISRRRAKRVPSGIMPNYKNRPTRAEEIFGAFAELQETQRICVPITSEDFHGDGIDGEIDVIYADSLPKLKLDVAILKPLAQLPVEWRDMQSNSLSGLGTPSLRLGRITLPAPGGLCLFSESAAFGLGHSGIAQPNPFTDGPNGYPIAAQQPTDKAFALADVPANDEAGITVKVSTDYTLGIDWQAAGGTDVSDGYSFGYEHTASRSIVNVGFYGQLAERFPGLIALDEVVKVNRSEFSGHVYNLSTESEWYFANDIITHNCQPAVYWREKFFRRGWDYAAPDTYRLVSLLALAFHASHHVEANLQVFLK